MKLWDITFKEKVEPQLRKKLKRLLKPVLSVARAPGKCYFCDTETTWTVNNQLVCPACQVQYGFLSQDIIPDPCEVCGRQGEWCTEGDPIHSLCFIHRDAWLGKDNKPHTKSIPASPLGEKITRINAQTELMLLQLDYMGGEYLVNSINSPPMITAGLTRVEAKQALHRELGSSPRLQTPLTPLAAATG